jgi:hypothetical protein
VTKSHVRDVVQYFTISSRSETVSRGDRHRRFNPRDVHVASEAEVFDNKLKLCHSFRELKSRLFSTYSIVLRGGPL